MCDLVGVRFPAEYAVFLLNYGYHAAQPTYLFSSELFFDNSKFHVFLILADLTDCFVRLLKKFVIKPKNMIIVSLLRLACWFWLKLQ